MLHFVTSYMKQNKSRKQTLESAQYGLEISFKPLPNDRNMPTQHVATLLGAICCVRLATLLRHVGCCWLKFENRQIFHAAFMDVAQCCSRLARSVQQCCTQACALVRFSIPNMLQHGGQTHTTCAQQCCDVFRLNVASVWPELANAGLTLLGYVALRCCYRLANAGLTRQFRDIRKPIFGESCSALTTL